MKRLENFKFMLTIATVPKPFKDPHINIIQRNAIQSWLRLLPKPKIILFGNDEGIDKAAKEFGVSHIPEVESEFGIPLLSSVFSLTRQMAESKFIAYVNTDIILLNDFMKAIELINFNSFLMTGRRWDIDIKESINFTEDNWEQRLRGLVSKEGKLHGPAGMDYFVFPQNSPLNMPAFVAGRPGYDGWLLYHARSLGITTIDATKAVMILHQNHGYKHRLGGEKRVLKEAEGKKNLNVAGGFLQMLTLRDTEWVLTKDGLKKPKFPRIIFSQLALFYPWRLLVLFKRKLQQFL